MVKYHKLLKSDILSIRNLFHGLYQSLTTHCPHLWIHSYACARLPLCIRNNDSLYLYLSLLRRQNIAISQLSIINTLAIICTNIGIFASNFKIISFSNRIVSLISALGISLSALSVSFCNHFVEFILIYGVVYGFCIGYGYMAPLKNCYDHLPDKKGLCSGTCLMGFGLGALFFNFVLVNLVNPDNVKQVDNLFPKQIGDNLPFALQVLSAIYAGLGIIGALLSIPHKSTDEQRNPLLELPIQSTSAQEKEEQAIKQNHFSILAIKFAIRHKIHLLLAALSLIVPFGFFMAFHFKEYASSHIQNDHYLSLLGSIGSVGNGLFRMILGATMDHIVFKKIMIANVLVFMLSCATAIFSVQNQASYLITVVLTYGCYGSLYSIFPTQTVRILGKKIGSKMYYITFIGFSFGAVLQYVCHRFLVQQFGQDGYKYCFIIFGVLLALGLVLVLVIQFTVHQTEQKIGIKIKQNPDSILDRDSTPSKQAESTNNK